MIKQSQKQTGGGEPLHEGLDAESAMVLASGSQMSTLITNYTDSEAMFFRTDEPTQDIIKEVSLSGTFCKRFTKLN